MSPRPNDRTTTNPGSQLANAPQRGILRSRRWLFVALCVFCLAGAAGYIVLAGQRVRPISSGEPSIVGDDQALGALKGKSRLMFLDVPHSATGRKVAVAPIDKLSGPRQLTTLECDR